MHSIYFNAKMTWMFFWRIALISSIFWSHIYFWRTLLVSLILSVVLYSSGRILYTWPLIRLIRGRGVFFHSQRRPSKFKKLSFGVNKNAGRKNKAVFDFLDQTRVDGKVAPNRNGAFSRNALDMLTIPRESERLIGQPGSGLDSAGGVFSEENLKAGQAGEAALAKALNNYPSANAPIQGLTILNNVYSAWSLYLPSEDSLARNDLETDIDCVLIDDKRIYLIDAKKYSAKNSITYEPHGGSLVAVLPNGKIDSFNAIKNPSRNMEMAQERFAKIFKDFEIISMIVFLPTPNGEPGVKNVTWPGDIPAVTLSEALQFLSTARATPNGRALDVLNAIRHLVKR